MIRTSYFAKYKGSDGVSICAISPKWWKGPVYRKLAPPRELVNMYKHGLIDTVEYEQRYNDEVLRHLDPHKIYDDLNGHVLLCYEKSIDFCHRHLVAKWLKAKLGILVVEI